MATCRRSKAGLPMGRRYQGIRFLGREHFALPDRQSSEDGPIFDALELAPVAVIDSEGTCEAYDDLEDVAEEDRDRVFWSVFGHTPGEGVSCLGDFPTRDEALEAIRRLTGRLRPFS